MYGILHGQLNECCLDADQRRTRATRHISPTIGHRTKRRKVLPVMLMLVLLVGFFGLFAGLVFFSEGVIEPESKS